MILRSTLVVLSFAICAEVHAGVFKCSDENGAISYQQRPCDSDSKTSEQLTIRSSSESGPVKLTSENKRLYKLAHYSDAIKFTAAECRRRGSSYSSEVTQAANRLFEIRQQEVEEGKKILQRGFPGLPPSEIATLRSDGKRKLLVKLAGMSRDELDHYCVSEASKARNMAAMATNRSSGYVEGDLDPEGND